MAEPVNSAFDLGWHDPAELLDSADARDFDSTLSWRLVREDDGSSGWLRVRNRTFVLPDGSESTWDLLDEHDCVSVLAITPDRMVIVARQFRPGPGSVLDDLPGGYIDEGEKPIDAARRELLEETGYEGHLQLVGQSWNSARNLHREWTFVAEGCVAVVEPSPDAGEFVAVALLTIDEFHRTLRAGRSTCLGSAYMAMDYLGLLR